MQAASVFEAAENGLENVTTQLPAGFNVINSRFYGETATHSFRFLHAGFSPSNQWITLNGSVAATTNTTLRFHSMLGLSDGGEMAVVQVSNNGGATWANVYTQTGFGNVGETSFQQKSVSLAAFAGQTLRVRFLYSWNGTGGWFWQDWENVNGQNSGWYIDRIEVRNGQTAVLSEGAENGVTNVTTQVPTGFNLINSSYSADTAAHSFRFLHAGFTPSDQWISLNSTIQVASNSELRFKSMLGLSDGGEMAVVQISRNGGQTWENIYTQTGFGNVGETSFQQKIVSLAGYAGQTLRLRFLYSWNGTGGWFWQDWENVNGQNSGWYVDMIEVRNVEAGGSTSVVPSIAQHPTSQTVIEGANVGFTVSASGTPAVSYQWRKNGNAISGATSATLNMNQVSTSAAGAYTVTVTNSAGIVTSNAAALTVLGIPSLVINVPAVTSSASITVSGTALNIASITAIRVNGTRVTSQDSFATWSLSNVPLNPGANTLTISYDTLITPDSPTVSTREVYRLTSSNLLNYAFNSANGSSISSGQPQIANESGGTVAAGEVKFSYRRRIDTSAIAYAIEVSEDLRAWRLGTSSELELLNPPVPNSDGVTETVTLRLRPTVKRFVRLAVSAL